MRKEFEKIEELLKRAKPSEIGDALKTLKAIIISDDARHK